MKKVIALVLALALVALVSAGCSDTTDESAAVKLGLGTITSIAKSRDYSVAEDGTGTLAMGQVDTVMAAVIFDKDGRVVRSKWGQVLTLDIHLYFYRT